MSKYEILEDSLIKYSFDVKKEDFEEALDNAFLKVQPTVEIKGFRKGKVTREIFEKKKGVESLFEDALDILLNKFYIEILKEKQDHVLRKLVSTDIDKDFKRGNDFKMFLIFDYIPEFELPKYEGIEVKEEKVKITDDLFKNFIRQSYPSLVSENKKESGVIEKGDVALFDFKGFVDGKAFEGGEASNFRLQIGSMQFIPGFEDQMVGMKKGEKKDILVTFPKDYHAKDLKGKEAKFEVKIKEVYVEVIDYKKASKDGKEVDPKEEEKRIKKELENHLLNNEKARQYEEALRTLVDSCNINISKYMVQEKTDTIINAEKKKAEQYRIPFEIYLQYMGYGSEENYYNQVKEVADKSVKLDIIIERIIQSRDFEVSEEEIKDLLSKTPGLEREQAVFFLKRSKCEKHILDNIKCI